MSEEILKIAIERTGKLHAPSMELIKSCGINISSYNKDKHTANALNYPLQVIYLRKENIPQYVANDVADIGIVDEIIAIEKEFNVDRIEKLGFAKCRLSLAIPKIMNYEGIEYFNNKKIATSFTNTVKSYFAEKDINAEIHTSTDSLEMAPGIGFSDGICDLVSSGGTLFSSGLKEVEEIMRSEAIIIKNTNLSTSKETLLNKLLFRMRSIIKAKKAKYIILNAPNENLENIFAILPGLKSPTVTPLVNKNWSAVHSVIYEKKFWEVIDKLKSFGAEGILVMPIEKMV